MQPITTREQAIDFLYGRIDYERMSASLSASDFKLDRMRNLLDRVGNPQNRVPAVHIAGTKGKGSTAAMIASILQAAGHQVGLFTSPHLHQYEERIRVNDQMIGELDLISLVSGLADATREIDAQSNGLSPTFFELTTALAWLWFERQGVDIAVVEVGLGGRLDSTTVCRPEVCVLTTVSRDHMHILGHRLSEIAAEKAGIIKPGIPVVSGVTGAEASVVIERIAAERGAELTRVDDESGQLASVMSVAELPEQLRSRHQQQNAAVATAAACALQKRGWNIDADVIRNGLQQVKCPVRIEVVNREPLVILDAAHNWASAGVLLETLQGLNIRGPRVLIFATSRDKDVPGLMRRLVSGFDCIILTEFQSNPRAMPLSQLQATIRRMTCLPVHSAATPREAWAAALRVCTTDGLICVAGSFFLAAELRDATTKKADPVGSAESCEIA